MGTTERSPSTHPRGRTGGAGIPSVLIVATNCSLRMGGEASLPFHYFRLLWERGAEIHLVAHERNRGELEMSFAGARDRLHFIRDDLPQKVLCALGQWLPHREIYRRALFPLGEWCSWEERSELVSGVLCSE